MTTRSVSCPPFHFLIKMLASNGGISREHATIDRTSNYVVVVAGSATLIRSFMLAPSFVRAALLLWCHFICKLYLSPRSVGLRKIDELLPPSPESPPPPKQTTTRNNDQSRYCHTAHVGRRMSRIVGRKEATPPTWSGVSSVAFFKVTWRCDAISVVGHRPP